MDETGPVEIVAADDWPESLPLLYQSSGPRERRERLATTLATAASGEFSLAGLRRIRRGPVTVGVSLTLAQPDGISLVWPPEVRQDDPEAGAIRERLLSEMCQRLDQEQVRLGQVLLDAWDDVTPAWLRPAGFCHETSLFFLGHDLKGDFGELAANVELRRFTDEQAPQFGRVLEATYRKSLDCPLLEGIRTGEEALASHRLSGVFDPDLWQIFLIRDPQTGQRSAAGVCLLNDHPDQEAVELTYFGVVPEFRGRQLGRELLRHALRMAIARGRASLFLAADAANDYANSLYGSMGFFELARRRVLFRPQFGAGPDSSTGS